MEHKPLFRDLNADEPEQETTVIESLCMNCHQNGMTRLLLTRIPHYKDVVLMSFSCEACGFRNNEIQPGGSVPERGVRFTLKVQTPADLNRQVVKSDYTSFKIEELDFEIPAQSQKGEVTTVEGVIRRAISGLMQDQETRRLTHPADAAQIDAFVARLEALLDCGENWKGFTITLEDISGNSHIENPNAPLKDPYCHRIDFQRTKEQDHIVGVFTREEVSEEQSTNEIDQNASSLLQPVDPESHSYEIITGNEVMTFRTNCPECNAPADTNMKVTNIPHFKEVVIMATTCDACGHKTNEVKSGGGIEEKGVRFEVRVNGPEDFSRDILKSETCSMEIPELGMEVGSFALGGRFTTTEGLLRATVDQLGESSELLGDSATSDRADRMESFLKRIEEVLQGKARVTLILDDPAGNSYVQSLNDDGTPDDGLKITKYERTFEQNDELGLNDMRTENYENHS